MPESFDFYHLVKISRRNLKIRDFNPEKKCIISQNSVLSLVRFKLPTALNDDLL